MQQSYDIGPVIRAVEFAAKKHRMQRRKDSGASPYINHPIALMHVLCIDGGINDPTILAAAALHDTIEHARHMSREATLVKLADKICNLRDMSASPPADWSLERQIEYFDWAKAVVDGLPRANARSLSE